MASTIHKSKNVFVSVNGRTGKGPNNRMQKFHSALMYFWQKELFLFDTMNSVVLNR